MRILFICGSIEPGKNGVGDYTLKLARGLAEDDYNVMVLSINEKNSIINGRLEDSNVKITRLIDKMSWLKRQKDISKIIKEFKPRIVSLQFVPNSFNNKGLPFFLPNMVQQLKKYKFQWHIMFHELWIANHKANSIREFFIRETQKLIIRRIIKKTGNAFIDTSNLYYKNMLQSLDVESGISQVFSNMSRGEKSVNIPVEKRKEKIVCILFGNIQYSNLLSNRINDLAKKVNTQIGKQICILQLGINRDQRSAQVLAELSQQKIIELKLLGFKNDLEVANIMMNSDLGLSNHLPHFINKSGSISSMLYNDLPVILLNETSDNFKLNPEIQMLGNISNLISFINQKKDFSHKYSPNHAVRYFQHKFDAVEKGQI